MYSMSAHVNDKGDIITFKMCLFRENIFPLASVEAKRTSAGYYYIRRLKVYPRLRNRGYGKKLMIYAITWLRWSRLELIYPENSPWLRTFYTKMGFHPGASKRERDWRWSDARRMYREPGKL